MTVGDPMTVNDLIARLTALPPEDRELPVLSSFLDLSSKTVLHDATVELVVQEVRTETIVGFHPYRDQKTVRALRIL